MKAHFYRELYHFKLNYNQISSLRINAAGYSVAMTIIRLEW